METQLVVFVFAKSACRKRPLFLFGLIPAILSRHKLFDYSGNGKETDRSYYREDKLLQNMLWG
jgi:hypothetical protein